MTAAAYLPDTTSLPKLREAAEVCHGCDLWRAATQTVFGAGTRNADVMFVGEQPGDKEDQQGQPFVGPAGRMLDKALLEVGIDRTRVYVTNAVKHFKWQPRGKRRIHQKPNWTELTACRPWLDAELAAVKPRVLVCLGATAAQSLLGRQFRVVVARQEQTAYRVDVSDKLPASALAVTLRDEQKFAEQYVPLTRAIGLIATFEQGVTTRESEHRGAKLVGWWVRDDPEAVAAGNRARYNFAPTYSITRGHFIIGSTRRIVEQVIDALDQQAADGSEGLAPYVTERQELSLTAVAASLRGIRDSFIRALAIDQGLTVEEAEQEFDVLAKIVAALGRITAESKFTDDAFEYRLRIEPATNPEAGTRTEK